jgi:hypothetical protein
VRRRIKMLFDFLMDMGNYEDRKVAHNDFPWGMIDTCAVSDGAQPFETAVEHKAYRKEGMVIVEAYSSKVAAEVGHKKWVKTMTAKRLPAKLVDCANAEVIQAYLEVGGQKEYPLLKKGK